MGCKTSTAVAVVSMDTVQVENQSLNNAQCSVQQNTIIHKIPSPFVETEINEKVSNRTSSFKSNECITKLHITGKLLPNESEDVIEIHASNTRSTSTKTTKSNVNQETIPSVTSSKSNKLNLHDNIDVQTKSTDLVEVTMRKTPVKSIVVESVISNNSKENIFYGILSDTDGSHFHYDDMVSSSSSSANAEKRRLRDDTFVRFISAKPNNSNAHPEIFTNDMFNGSDESYPLHDSFVTSTSSNADDSSILQEDVLSLTSNDKQESHDQLSVTTNNASNEPDVINSNLRATTGSISNNSDEILTNQKVMVKSKSSDLYESDIHQKTIDYETSIDSIDL